MIHWHDVLPSTMDAAHALAREGASPGTGIVAREQTTGRGRRGKRWASPRGGLWLSVVCRTDAGGHRGTLAVRAGLAAAELLDRLIAPHVIEIKWPNDLLVQGRKLAGILVEGRWADQRIESLVVGLGLNVSNSLPPDVPGGATRLADLTSSVPSLDTLAEGLCTAITDAVGVTGDLSEDERSMFDRRDALRGRAITQPKPGVADGISPSGELLVREDNGVLHRVAGGEVLNLG